MLRTDYNNLRSTIIALNNFILYSHCQVVQRFRLTSLHHKFNNHAQTNISFAHALKVFRPRFFLCMEVSLRVPCCVIAERRAQSRHMNHSRRSIVKRWHANTIQQRDTARNCTKRSRNFWATAGGSSIGP